MRTLRRIREARSAALGAALFAVTLALSHTAIAASRALLVGIDDYAHVQKLRGAVADVRDVEQALRATGVADVAVLTETEARRASVLQAFDRLLARVQPGDTVFVVLAGNGAEEPERVKGAHAEGTEAVFLLQPFDPADPQLASEKILESEFTHYMRKIEAAGGRTVFVADTASGGGLARSVDPRADDLVYRSLKYAPIADRLESVADQSDAFAVRTDFQRSIFLAAADRTSRVPELQIPGVGHRGALSYAFARALEGAADVDGDARLTTSELFEYVGQVVNELSDQRQVVVLERPAREAPDRDVVAEGARGISVRPAGAADAASAELEIIPAEAAPAEKSSPVVTAKPRRTGFSHLPGAAVKLAALDGRNGPLGDLTKTVPVTLVAPNENPDLIWDPRTHDVLSGPDIVARDVAIADLPGVVERTALLSALKKNAAAHPQSVRLLSGDDLHRKGSRVEIEIKQLAGRYLILFDVPGNGAVQLLYPLGSDPPRRVDDRYSIQFYVREPFGADLVVAITANQRMEEIEKLLEQARRRLDPARLLEHLVNFERHGLRLGYVGVFTAP